MPVILATQEAEIRRIAALSQPQANSLRDLSQNSADGVTQGEGPKFKHQYHKNKTKQSKIPTKKV
jgi:hypothetical protein